jgi:hypothetical protein
LKMMPSFKDNEGESHKDESFKEIGFSDGSKIELAFGTGQFNKGSLNNPAGSFTHSVL